MKIKGLVLSMILMSGCQAMAQISTMSEDSKVILNQQLRYTDRRLTELEGGISLTSRVTGILPIANGGTNLSSTSDDTLIVGLNSSTYQLKTLPNCPGGTLAYTTSSNTFTCAAGVQDFELISATSFSAVTTSGLIPITTGKTYRVVVEVTHATPTAQMLLLFNNDSTGGSYQYYNTRATLANPPVVTNVGSSSASFILINPSIQSAGFFIGDFTISTFIAANPSVFGKSFSINNSGAYMDINFSGIFSGSPTSFQIDTDGGTITGAVYLYALIHS